MTIPLQPDSVKPPTSVRGGHVSKRASPGWGCFSHAATTLLTIRLHQSYTGPPCHTSDRPLPKQIVRQLDHHRSPQNCGSFYPEKIVPSLYCDERLATGLSIVFVQVQALSHQHAIQQDCSSLWFQVSQKDCIYIHYMFNKYNNKLNLH